MVQEGLFQKNLQVFSKKTPMHQEVQKNQVVSIVKKVQKN